MEELNWDLSFSALKAEDRNAFMREPEKKRLDKKFQLYRWGIVTPGRDFSPWWSSVEPLAADDPGLSGNLQLAGQLSIGLDAYERSRKAVSYGFGNPMNNLLLVALLEPTWALVGRCSNQPVLDQNNLPHVVYIGGAYQVYIPNLNAGNVKLLKNAAFVEGESLV